MFVPFGASSLFPPMSPAECPNGASFTRSPVVLCHLVVETSYGIFIASCHMHPLIVRDHVAD
jgi:hypothetical protein